MKKNVFSDNRKSSKGFYAALGISAVMIGSACYFAYDQGEKLSQEILAQNNSSVQEAAVDGKVTNIPKQNTTAPATIAAEITLPPVNAPAAEIVPEYEEPVFNEEDSVYSEEEPVFAEDEEEDTFYGEDVFSEEVPANAGASHMENVKPPLDDMSNIIGVFSGKELVKNETTGSWQTHNGTDIAAGVGCEVYAVSNGGIKSVENDPLWGITVVIDHYNGFMTKYCGLSDDLQIQEGDSVLSGDIIGYAGNTADVESSLEPHIHIEITQNGAYIDPMSVLL